MVLRTIKSFFNALAITFFVIGGLSMLILALATHAQVLVAFPFGQLVRLKASDAIAAAITLIILSLAPLCSTLCFYSPVPRTHQIRRELDYELLSLLYMSRMVLHDESLLIDQPSSVSSMDDVQKQDDLKGRTAEKVIGSQTEVIDAQLANDLVWDGKSLESMLATLGPKIGDLDFPKTEYLTSTYSLIDRDNRLDPDKERKVQIPDL